MLNVEIVASIKSSPGQAQSWKIGDEFRWEEAEVSIELDR